MSSRSEQTRNSSGNFDDFRRATAQESPAKIDLASQEYLDALEKYKGHPLYSELVNNPYRYFTGHQTFFGGIGDDLGLWTSSFAKNRQQQQISFNEAFQAAMEKINAYDINLPSNQANLERQAGLNPDLAGISGTGTVSDADNPISSPQFTANDELAPVKEVGTAAMSFIQGLVSLAQGFQVIESNSYKLVADEIRNHKDAMDFAIESIAKSAPFKDVNELDSSDPIVLADMVIKASDSMDYSAFSRRSRKLIKNTFNHYNQMLRSGKDVLGVAALKAQLRNQFVQNQSEASRGAGQLGFSESFNDMVQFVGERFAKAEYDLEQLALKSQKKAYEAGNAEYDYNKKYFRYANSQGLHRAAIDDEIKGHKASEEYNSSQEIINGAWDDIMKYLQGGDEWFNTLGIVLAAYIRSQSFHIPSINISGPKITNNSWSNSYDSHDYNQKKSVIRFANQ